MTFSTPLDHKTQFSSSFLCPQTSMESTNFSCGVNRASRLNKTLYSLPVHCLNEQDLQHENARGIMAHFHAPENEHNRFLASLTQQERAILRHIERPSPYNSKSAKPGVLRSQS
jgi:hypothetical protein